MSGVIPPPIPYIPDTRKVWCWRRMEIIWTDCLRSEILQSQKEGICYVFRMNRRKAIWIGDVLCWNCLLKHVIEGKKEGRIEGKEEEVSSYWMILRKREGEIEIRSTRLHCVENLLWNRLWTCRKTDCRTYDQVTDKQRDRQTDIQTDRQTDMVVI
jgi:hypothetical protein